jgi:hypothetical protein
MTCSWQKVFRHSSYVAACALLLGCSSDEGASSGQPTSTPFTITFMPTGGTFVGSETVTLKGSDGAELHFTTDGSLPTEASPVYAAPLALSKSTRLRAVAVLPETVPGAGSVVGAAASETYLRVASDAQDFKSHLPVFVIHTFESGKLNQDGTEFVSANLEVLEPQGGTASLVGQATLDVRIGIHVRGATSRGFPKKQYAVELRGEASDDDTDQALLGLPAESDWVLSDPISFDRTLIRNALAYELSNRIGRYAPRTRFAEAFLVDDGGDVRTANFLGFYTLIEKIKRGHQRVDVQKLDANDVTDPAFTGGYVLRIDKGTNDFRAAGQDFQFVYPDPVDMKVAGRAPQVSYIRTDIDDFGLAVGARDFLHPTTHQPYSDYIDVDAFVDHNIINALTKNVDALRISAYFNKPRSAKLAAGPVWDFDRSLGTPYDPRAKAPEEWKLAGSDGTDYFNEGFWQQLFRDPAFKARYKSRFETLLATEFAPDKLDALIDSLVASVGDAAARDFARWPDSPPKDGSYQAEVSVLKDFLRRRVAFIKAQLASGF